MHGSAVPPPSSLNCAKHNQRMRTLKQRFDKPRQALWAKSYNSCIRRCRGIHPQHLLPGTSGCRRGRLLQCTPPLHGRTPRAESTNPKRRQGRRHHRGTFFATLLSLLSPCAPSLCLSPSPALSPSLSRTHTPTHTLSLSLPLPYGGHEVTLIQGVALAISLPKRKSCVLNRKTKLPTRHQAA